MRGVPAGIVGAAVGRPRTKTAYTRATPRPERTIIGKLSTHVLDTAHGCPAAGMAVTLFHDDHRITTMHLGADGRAPLLQGEALTVGRYRLVFAVADYFRARHVALPDPPFLDLVPIDFAVADAQANYHVPLLVSPWSYSTYRGS